MGFDDGDKFAEPIGKNELLKYCSPRLPMSDKNQKPAMIKRIGMQQIVESSHYISYIHTNNHNYLQEAAQTGGKIPWEEISFAKNFPYNSHERKLIVKGSDKRSNENLMIQ